VAVRAGRTRVTGTQPGGQREVRARHVEFSNSCRYDALPSTRAAGDARTLREDCAHVQRRLSSQGTANARSGFPGSGLRHCDAGGRWGAASPAPGTDRPDPSGVVFDRNQPFVCPRHDVPTLGSAGIAPPTDLCSGAPAPPTDPVGAQFAHADTRARNGLGRAGVAQHRISSVGTDRHLQLAAVLAGARLYPSGDRSGCTHGIPSGTDRGAQALLPARPFFRSALNCSRITNF
jgi:hypothetical protein